MAAADGRLLLGLSFTPAPCLATDSEAPMQQRLEPAVCPAWLVRTALLKEVAGTVAPPPPPENA